MGRGVEKRLQKWVKCPRTDPIWSFIEKEKAAGPLRRRRRGQSSAPSDIWLSPS